MSGYLIARIVDVDVEIISIEVVLNRRKEGNAKELINQLFNFCKDKKLRNIYLEVCIKNIPAINLYLSSGFKKKGKRNKYYKVENHFYDALMLEYETNN